MPPRKQALIADFHDAMLNNYRRAGEETGYWGSYFLRSVRRHGGLETAKRMLAKTGDNATTKGFARIVEAGRPDLTVEHLATSDRFRDLFTEEELEEAARRLRGLRALVRRTARKAETLHPEDVIDTAYAEGHLRTVTVNAYERSRTARAACLRKHGRRCAVCDFSFHEHYGEIGRTFIHVHHRRPLALRKRSYTVDPGRDLVPVCPNCHAMLHTSEPPLGIDELKAIMAEAARAATPARRRAGRSAA